MQGFYYYDYYVRIGSWGEIAPARSSGGGPYRRGTRVICRTPRGVEVAQVTAEAAAPPAPTAEASAAEASSAESSAAAVRILRATTAEDELLIARLERHRRDAMDACRRTLAAAGSSAVLLEVDQVFDAGTLIFYFLSPPDSSDQQLVQQLAQRYESKVRSGHFAKLLAQGCGPGCGTKDCGSEDDAAAGSSRGGCSGGCAVCVVATTSRQPK